MNEKQMLIAVACEMVDAKYSQDCKDATIASWINDVKHRAATITRNHRVWTGPNLPYHVLTAAFIAIEADYGSVVGRMEKLLKGTTVVLDPNNLEESCNQYWKTRFSSVFYKDHLYHTEARAYVMAIMCHAIQMVQERYVRDNTMLGWG